MDSLTCHYTSRKYPPRKSPITRSIRGCGGPGPDRVRWEIILLPKYFYGTQMK